MDKNSIIGYVLIALVLGGFFYLNQPDPEKIEAQRRYQDSIAALEYEQEQLRIEEIKEREARLNEQKSDSSSFLFNALKGEAKNITLRNEKLSIDISTLGARITSATLADYNNQEGAPITLFSATDETRVSGGRRGKTEKRRTSTPPICISHPSSRATAAL